MTTLTELMRELDLEILDSLRVPGDVLLEGSLTSRTLDSRSYFLDQEPLSGDEVTLELIAMAINQGRTTYLTVGSKKVQIRKIDGRIITTPIV